MENAQKYFFPLSVVAALVAIWAVLRKPSSAVPSVIQSSNVPSPAVTPPLQPQTVVMPSPSATFNYNYINAAAQNPLSPNPTAAYQPQLAPSSYLTFNLPAASDTTKQAMAVAVGQAGGCGSAKPSCGCAADHQTPEAGTCRTQIPTNRFSDGAGACLTTKPKIAGLKRSLLNLAGYVGA
jgi:hypothetical protein